MQSAIRNEQFAAKLAMAYGEYLDGVRPALQRVSMRLQGEGNQAELELRNSQTGAVEMWRLSKLRVVPDQAVQDGLVLARSDTDPARLIVRDRDAARMILAATPRVRSLGRTPGAWPRIAILGAAALASIAAILFLLIPHMADRGADLVPPEVEVSLGESGFTQTMAMLGARECTNIEGGMALQRMTDRLSVGLDLPYPLRVRVVDHPMINAFAFSGGHIAVFRGLIDMAETPDEVAAVLAHEIGHVANRDGTRTTLRIVGSFGIGGLVFGDVLGTSGAAGLTQRYLRSSYSREAEMAADAFAHRQMERAGLPVTAMADMFERMNRIQSGGDAGVFQHFSSHPELLARVETARAAGQGSPAATSVLSQQDWQALQGICN